MIEAKFTKGPWRLSAGNETEVFSRGTLNVARANCGGMTGIRLAEAEANAHLIAAAPELYEALADLLAAYATDDMDEQCTSVYGAIRALAKARGEQ